jgi:hypothetical protein
MNLPDPNTTVLNMPGKLIQTTISLETLRKLDALARAQGHRRASYLRHLVELHVRAISPRLLKITEKTSPLDELGSLLDVPDNRKRRR